MSSFALLSRIPAFFKKAAILGLSVPLILSQQGCTDDEVIASIGVIAIVGGAIAIGSAVSNNDRNDRHDRHDRYDRNDRYRGGRGSCRSGHRRHCTSYNDRWGSHRQECREVYEGCRYYNSGSMSLELAGGASESGSDLDLGAQIQAIQAGQAAVRTPNVVAAPVLTPQLIAVRLASRLGVSFDASEKLMAALDAGKNGDLSAISALGLDNDDLQRLGSMQMITDAGLERLAQSLEIGVESARGAVATLIGELRTQSKDINSPYWKACTSGGKWKTPQNVRCEETFWQGCSPQNGATMCAVAI